MTTTIQTTLTLSEVSEHFERWRSERKKGERIPEPLWGEAVKLLDEHNASQVARALRLSYTCLKQRRRRLDSDEDGELAGGKALFVELDPEFVDQVRPPSARPGAIELERADGTRLRLQPQSRAEMLAVVGYFMGAGSCCS
jgi:hypothetical protein